jgi:transmembrane 9 superfamily protein 2/4
MQLPPGTALACAFLAIPQIVSAFYLPGVAPTNYDKGDLVPLTVNRLTPRQSDTDPSLHSALSYDYYHPAFHFCRPNEGPRDVGAESLGAIVFGDRIKTSPFELKMMQNETCKRLCDTQTINGASAKFVNRRMEQHYALNWLVDGLPAGQQYETDDNVVFYRKGFPLGEEAQNQDPETLKPVTNLNNHYDIVVDYHPVGDGKFRVVGVLVVATSRKDSKNNDDKSAFCGDPTKPLVLDEASDNKVTYTYSVYWVPSKVAWAVRWDMYMHVEEPKIHWFSLVNSTIIVVFLVGTVSAILLRALKKDFARYNRLDTFNLDDFSATDLGEDGVQEDSGWKLVHGDVFRPPPSPLLLSVFLGNGAQLFAMTGTTIIFALFGFLSPSNRGSLGTAMLILYTILGGVGGYVSARIYKTFGGEAWKKNIAMTPVLVPGVVFSTFFLLNLFLWFRGSSGAVPFTTMLVLVSIWFVITVPLSVAGSWLGFKQEVSTLTLLHHEIDLTLGSRSPPLFERTRSQDRSHQQSRTSVRFHRCSLSAPSHSDPFLLNSSSSSTVYGSAGYTTCSDSCSYATD